MNKKLIEELVALQKAYEISPSGEGGEIETTVLDAPLFRKKIEVLNFTIEENANSGIYLINKARLVEK